MLPPDASPASRWRRHLTADVNRDWADLVLVLCYLVTGLLDSASISVWASFVSMQTGEFALTYYLSASSVATY